MSDTVRKSKDGTNSPEKDTRKSGNDDERVMKMMEKMNRGFANTIKRLWVEKEKERDDNRR